MILCAATFIRYHAHTAFIIIYIVYIVVVVVGRIVNNKLKDKSVNVEQIGHPDSIVKTGQTNEAFEGDIESALSLSSKTPTMTKLAVPVILDVCPIDYVNWSETAWYWKIYQIAKVSANRPSGSDETWLTLFCSIGTTLFRTACDHSCRRLRKRQQQLVSMAE